MKTLTLNISEFERDVKIGEDSSIAFWPIVINSLDITHFRKYRSEETSLLSFPFFRLRRRSGKNSWDANREEVGFDDTIVATLIEN